MIKKKCHHTKVLTARAAINVKHKKKRVLCQYLHPSTRVAHNDRTKKQKCVDAKHKSSNFRAL